MQKKMTTLLQCLQCGSREWDIEVLRENDLEVRDGTLKCLSCGHAYPVRSGILNVLGDDLPPEVLHEKQHAETFDYFRDEGGRPCRINRETLERYKDIFLSLPAGDGSSLFQPGGGFSNQAGNADRFFEALEVVRLTGNENVLEVGASFGWGARRFAARGCATVALDVTDYLQAADLYMENDGIYYDRIMADMSMLPFADSSFDLIFAHSVLHHCRDLEKLFAEFYRVLKPGGRVAALHECAFGLLEDRSGKALKEAMDEGFNENAYTLPQWKQGAVDGGFERVWFYYFSIFRSYLTRKRIAGGPETTKLRAAQWIVSKPLLHGVLNKLLEWPRVLFRPRAWMILAQKSATE